MYGTSSPAPVQALYLTAGHKNILQLRQALRVAYLSRLNTAPAHRPGGEAWGVVAWQRNSYVRTELAHSP
jgi:hypothetical protein